MKYRKKFKQRAAHCTGMIFDKWNVTRSSILLKSNRLNLC